MCKSRPQQLKHMQRSRGGFFLPACGFTIGNGPPPAVVGQRLNVHRNQQEIEALEGQQYKEQKRTVLTRMDRWSQYTKIVCTQKKK